MPTTFLVSPFQFAAAAAAPVAEGFGLSTDDLGNVSARTATFNGLSGELLLGFIVNGSGVQTLNLPTNWADADAGTIAHDSLSAFLTRWMWDVIGANQASQEFTISGSTDEWWPGVVRISGAHATTPIHQIAFDTSQTTTDPVSPDLTTTVDNCLIVRIMITRDVSLTDDTGYPSGTTGVFVRANVGAEVPVYVGVAWEEKATAGAVGTKTWATITNARVIMGTIAIAPAG